MPGGGWSSAGLRKVCDQTTLAWTRCWRTGRHSAGLLSVHRQQGVLVVYLVPAVLVLAGLVPHATRLVLGGVVACPFVPVLSWLLIRRRLVRGVPGHRRGP
jgi:hypothetical protein